MISISTLSLSNKKSSVMFGYRGCATPSIFTALAVHHVVPCLLEELRKVANIAGSGWLWMALAGSGVFWMALGGSGWLWVALGGSGWLWVIPLFSNTVCEAVYLKQRKVDRLDS